MSIPSQVRPEVAGHHVDQVIGEGGSSVVWSGTDAVGRAVAIKVPHALPDAVDLMQAEIERHVLQAVRHPNLVSLRDAVALPDGRVALVFERVRGSTLSATVGARGRLSPSETVWVLAPLCEAVATLHAAGGTHGDISAHNVLVTPDAGPVLMDLGAARLAGAGSGAVHGTAGFVAPEVRAGEAPPSEASDVFALGALAWFCLTGNGAPDTTIRLDPETIESHVGAELAGVIGQCIDPDPSVRPGAAQLARLVFDAAPARPVESVVGGDEATALTHRLRLEAARVLPGPPPSRFRAACQRLLVRRPRRVLVPGSVALLVCAAIIGSCLLVRSGAARGLFDGSATATVPTATVPTATVPTATGTPTVASTATGTPTSARPTDVTRDLGAPRTGTVALLQALADRRAAALTGRDLKGLEAVHRPGGPTARADRAIVEQLVANGQTYSGLRLTVVAAQPVAGAARDDDHAAVRARVDVAAYRVVRADGTSTALAAAAGESLDFELVRTALGWRIESITEPRAT